MLKVLAAMLGLVLISGIVFATYEESNQAGIDKRNVKNWDGAIFSFKEALGLCANKLQESDVRMNLSECYFGLSDSINALAELEKVANMTEGREKHIAYANFYLGNSLPESEKFKKVLALVKALTFREGILEKNTKDLALYLLGNIKLSKEENLVLLEKLQTLTHWFEYYHRGKTKEELMDWQGAYADLDEAWRLRPDDNNAKKMILQELEDVKMRLP